ncbi:MAG: hypothetical protein HYX72_07230 [Acidobacteria bacterium]|nr:hypothetical protein [Acidobacteriota bacterium]
MNGKSVLRPAIVLIAVLTATVAWPQQRRMGGIRPPSVTDDITPSPSRSLNRKMLKASYEQLQKDVQRLSDLASELEEQVTITDDEDVLSLSGVKKAEEIEKLAKKIQNRMKNL